LPLLGLVLVIAIGLGYSQIWHKPAKPATVERKYVSFNGNYLFSIPSKYTANGTAIPGVTLVYPEASLLQKGQSLNDLYTNGTVAVQPIAELKDNNPEVFMTYVTDVLAANLRKIFNSASDLRPSKQKGIDATEVSALGEAGKLLRVDYAIDFTQPVLVVAQDRSDSFKTIGFSMEDLKKSSLKSDIDLAAEVTKEVAQKLKDQKAKELRKKSTAEFKKQKSEAQLAAMLKDSNAYLQRPISIVGGLYNGEFFIAQLVFEAKAQGEQPTPGIVSLQKIGKTWKLDGLQLPK
jgi:arsenate reductase-like glutaredoxin family protein